MREPKPGSGFRPAALALLLLLAACGRASGPAPAETPTSGSIAIASDESFRPVVQSQIDVFTGIYPGARIEARWLPEEVAIRELVEGRVRLAVVSRPLNAAEEAAFAREKLVPRAVFIARDGIALLTHRANPDSLVTIDQLRGLFEGRIRDWAELGGKQSGEIIVVFDQNGSSNLNFILHRFGLQELDGVRVYAARSSAGVIAYVQEHPRAIGIVGGAWISDPEDPKQEQLLRRVALLRVADTPDPALEDYHRPDQPALALGRYPLVRDVLILSREARSGLGSGFMTHTASDRGQRIVLKSGLLPVTMPGRLVQITDGG